MRWKRDVSGKLPEITELSEYKKTHLVSLMKYEYNLAEIKCCTALMFLASLQLAKDENLRNFTAHIRDITRYSGIQYSHDKLKEIILGLQRKPLVLNFLGKHGPREEFGPIVSWIGIEENNPVIDFQFPDRIQSELHRPDYYTLIRMMSHRVIASKYTYCIYEFCKSYVGVGTTPAKTVEEFREFLGLKDEYALFSELERNVIKPSAAEINNSLSPIEIHVTPVKERDVNNGKKMGTIKFLVRSKLDVTKDDDSFFEPLERLMTIIPDRSRTTRNREMIKLFLASKGEEYCIAAIQFAFTTCKNINSSFTPYLSKTLDNDYGHEVRRNREMEKELRAIKGGHPPISDMDPVADRIYNAAYDSITEDKKKNIHYELKKRIEGGRIKEKAPMAMKIRQA